MNNILNNDDKAKIREMFESIQGEGPCIGSKQIFVRFCACNLRCYYCDTDYMPKDINDKSSYFEFSPKELAQYLSETFDLDTIHSISLTGGEPLIWSDFLSKFMPLLNVKYYLETNATISENIEQVLQYTDIIAADIKLPSCSGIIDSFEKHDKFFDAVRKSRVSCAIEKEFNCDNKNIFAKIVFDENITEEEIEKSVALAKKYDFEIVLQPRMLDDKMTVSSKFLMSVFEKFVKLYKNTRLIPQVHKFINVE